LKGLLRCPRCNFITARLDHPIDTVRLYGQDYFAGQEYLDYRSDEMFLKKNFRVRLDAVLQRRGGGRLLEIGAAYGFFLDLAKEYFDVVGFEVNSEAARYGRDTFGVDIRGEDLLDSGTRDAEDPFDVAVMWDVIEHLERPDLMLERVNALSRLGALLYITTGDIGSLVARLRGAKWRMIHPPTHLHYFSRMTLQRLLANQGFRVLEVRPVSVARSVRQMLYSWLVLHLKQRAAYQALERVVPATWGFAVNTFDIIQMVAEKVQLPHEGAAG
jgi:2-polyprenyl-3-methyl-5-hydroxy-6-metoxy-1,4-benzoquinol methylase